MSVYDFPFAGKTLKTGEKNSTLSVTHRPPDKEERDGIRLEEGALERGKDVAHNH
jgi:hypothetical protein